MQSDFAFSFSPIGLLRSPFKNRYGVPRQAGLVSVRSEIELFSHSPDMIRAIEGLSDFSHLWLIFVFHDHGGKNWKPSVRPPRLGGSLKKGVLSTRSPHRPNPIGISAVKLEKIILPQQKNKNEKNSKSRVLLPEMIKIVVSGADLIDGTPILDIKPYLPYADSIPSAEGPEWLKEENTGLYPVQFSDVAECELKRLKEGDFNSVKEFIATFLAADPRPGYLKKRAPYKKGLNLIQKFGVNLMELEIKYEFVSEKGFFVTEIMDQGSSKKG